MGLELKDGVLPFNDCDDLYTMALYGAGIIEGDTLAGVRNFNPLNSPPRR